MAEPLRIDDRGGYYHMTNRGVARQDTLLDTPDRGEFVSILKQGTTDDGPAKTEHPAVGGRAASYPAGVTQLPGEGQTKFAADGIDRPTSTAQRTASEAPQMWPAGRAGIYCRDREVLECSRERGIDDA